MGGKRFFDFYADQTATIWAMLEPATHGIGTLARAGATALIARQLGTVNSRRVSLAVGLWGEPGIGKTHAALTQALRERAEALLESEPAEAGRLGSILVEMEPFDAAALRLAVQGFEQSGNIRAARSAYRDGQSRILEVGVMLPETIESFLHDQTST